MEKGMMTTPFPDQ